MLTASLIANLVLIMLVIAFYILFRTYQRRLYRNEGRDLGDPVRTIQPSEFDELFSVTELGPTPKAEVFHIGSGDGVPYGTADNETWFLSVLSK
jgi:hypothetical protein